MCNAVVVGLSALASVLQGKAQRDAYNSQAAAAEQNARIADMQATESVKRGGRVEGDIRRRFMQVMGSSNTAAAASGIAADSGTLADIAAQSAYNMERDVATNAYNHAAEAWGYNSQAINYRNQASGYRAAGQNAFMGGLIGGATQLLTLATPDWFGRAGNKAILPSEGLYTQNANASLAHQQGNSLTGISVDPIFSEYQGRFGMSAMQTQFRKYGYRGYR